MSVKTKYKEKSEGMIIILKVIKSLFVSLIITFASIIAFAFVIKYFNLSDKIISPVNLGIKALSLLVGILVLNKQSSKKLINGIIFAIVYTLISFVIFSLLAGNFVLGLGLVLDFGFNIVVGIVASFLSALGKNA